MLYLGRVAGAGIIKNETFLPLGMSAIKWVIVWVSCSSGQTGKATEKWLHGNIGFHGLFCLFGVREVQRYSRAFIFGSNICFRWTGGSFLKQANGFQTMSLLQWSLQHNDTGPSHPFSFLSHFWQFLKFRHQCCLRSVEELFLGWSSNAGHSWKMRREPRKLSSLLTLPRTEKVSPLTRHLKHHLSVWRILF